MVLARKRYPSVCAVHGREGRDRYYEESAVRTLVESSRIDALDRETVLDY